MEYYSKARIINFKIFLYKESTFILYCTKIKRKVEFLLKKFIGKETKVLPAVMNCINYWNNAIKISPEL